MRVKNKSMEIQVSTQFKERGKKAIFSVIIFILVYFLLLIGGLSLAVACGILGFLIIGLRVNFLTIGLGGGVIGVGVIVLIFLIKFIFKRTKHDKSGWVELKKKDEPALFKFIEDIAVEAGAPLPKKVYLSHEVNASVFYDSSFWSMFFPVKKNLLIGYGLANTTTVQEFKATLAHEFGHFSQKSMKVGSYVYQLNKIIYNMLYENESLFNGMKTWSSFNWFFSTFVSVASWIIKGIQWVLQKLYNKININHMALSREMEFYADEVGANLAGSVALKDLLLRLDISDNALSKVFGFYDTKISDNVKSNNVFKEQLVVLDVLVKDNHYPTANGLPHLSFREINKYNKSKLVIEDQWASHPSTEERVKALDILDITTENIDNRPARDLFVAPESTEAALTKMLFADIPYPSTPQELSISDFAIQFIENEIENGFEPIYNGYYDVYNPLNVDVNITDISTNFQEFFTEEKVSFIYELQSLNQDLFTLNGIKDGIYEIGTFDYDGKKYTKGGASEIVKELEGELNSVKEELNKNDQRIYAYFFDLAKERGEEVKLRAKYAQFLQQDKEYDLNHELNSNIQNQIAFVAEETPYEKITANFKGFHKIEEDFKIKFKQLIENKLIAKELQEESKKRYKEYLENTEEYFDGKLYKDDILSLLWEAIGDFPRLNSRLYYLTKKDLLNFQASLLTK